MFLYKSFGNFDSLFMNMNFSDVPLHILRSTKTLACTSVKLMVFHNHSWGVFEVLKLSHLLFFSPLGSELDYKFYHIFHDWDSSLLHEQNWCVQLMCFFLFFYKIYIYDFTEFDCLIFVRFVNRQQFCLFY